MEGITELKHFISTDYANLYPSDYVWDYIFRFLVNPVTPFLSVLLYLCFSEPCFNFIRESLNLKPKGTIIQSVTILHSLLLAIYSIWTFVNAIQIVVPVLAERGLYGTLCDSNLDLWETRGLGFWVTQFYASKFYEFLDTWIVILKGRKPMFLQTYHHAGVIVIMWALVVTKNTSSGAVLVCFNSFIHSLMYTYYVFAAMGYSSPLKAFLTQAQIIQFIVGIALIIPAHFIDGCINSAQAFAANILQLYVVILIFLFAGFYINSYSKKKE